MTEEISSQVQTRDVDGFELQVMTPGRGITGNEKMGGIKINQAVEHFVDQDEVRTNTASFGATGYTGTTIYLCTTIF